MSGGDAGFGRNLAALSLVRLAGLGSSFLAAVVAARLLEPTMFGAAGVGQSFAIMIAVIANCGLSMAAIYRLRRTQSVAQEVQSILGLAVPLAALAAICASVGLAVASPTLGLPADGGLLLAIVILAVATLAADVSNNLLLGIGANGQYAVAEGLRYVTLLPLVLVAVLVMPSAAGYVAASTAALIITTLFALIMVRRTVHAIRPRVRLRTWVDSLAFGLRGQPGNVLQYVSLRLDLLLVGAIAGLESAAIYLVVTRIAEVPTQVANAATSFLFPAVARVGSSNRLTVDVIREVIVVVAAMSIGLAVIGPVLLPVLFGPPYDTGYVALVILLVASIPLSYGRLLSGDIKGRGRPGLVSLASLIGVPITLVGNLVLIPYLGIVGAAGVSVVAYSATAFALAQASRRLSGIGATEFAPTMVDVRLVGRRTRDAIRRLAARRHGGEANT